MSAALALKPWVGSPDADERLNARLRERLELAEERVAYLERVLNGTNVWIAPKAWGLTPAERMVLGVLVSRSLATKDAILAAIHRDPLKDEPDPKICDVLICKIRQKVARLDVEIETVWGCGWRLSSENRARLKMLGA